MGSRLVFSNPPNNPILLGRLVAFTVQMRFVLTAAGQPPNREGSN